MKGRRPQQRRRGKPLLDRRSHAVKPRSYTLSRTAEVLTTVHGVHTRTRAHIHTRARTYTHVYTHTYTHRNIYMLGSSIKVHLQTKIYSAHGHRRFIYLYTFSRGNPKLPHTDL